MNKIEDILKGEMMDNVQKVCHSNWKDYFSSQVRSSSGLGTGPLTFHHHHHSFTFWFWWSVTVSD
jgi:hypothetical protein